MYLIERSGKFIREILHLLLDRTSFIKCRSRRLLASCALHRARAVRSWRGGGGGRPLHACHALMRTRARTYVARRAPQTRDPGPPLSARPIYRSLVMYIRTYILTGLKVTLRTANKHANTREHCVCRVLCVC